MQGITWYLSPFLLLLLLIQSAGADPVGHAPATLPASDTTDVQELFDQGYAAYQEEAYERSRRYFRQLITVEETFTDAEHGPALYWFGRALEASERRDEALVAWHAGLTILDVFSLPLADAYVRGVFEEEKEELFEHASNVYLAILGRLGTPVSEAEESVLASHIAELCLILPETMASETGLEPCETEEGLPSVEADAGEQLAEWWRSQDGLFATTRNERLEEHLHRVAHARQTYWFDGAFDDRGTTYIRYGPPEHERRVRFEDVRGLQGRSTLTYDVQRNAFWSYPGVDRSAHFLYIHDDDGAYRLAEANELIPPTYRGTRRRALEAVYVLKDIYRQLSLYHIDYATIFEEVAHYADDLAFARMGAASPARTPSTFVQSTLSHARNEDFQIRHRRNERLPEAATNIHRYTETLDLGMRTLRFLEDDGTTRADIYWTTRLDDLEPNRNTRRFLRDEDLEDKTEAYVVQGTVVTFHEGYTTSHHDQGQHRIPLEEESDDAGMLASIKYSLQMDEEPADVGIQWDQYVIVRDDSTDALEVGPQIKLRQERVDGLRPLSADPAQLEMSDLMPLWIPEDSLAVLEEGFTSYVYPYTDIANDTDLALYFEVYHLEPDNDGLHRFSVEYEVARQSFASLQGLILGDPEDRTTVRTEYVNEEPTAREHIMLELVEGNFIGTVTIAVRVRDEVSGQEVHRMLPFSIIDPTRPARRW